MSGGVGVFGGTFNPIHLGHLRAAEEVREALGLRRVVFVPSGHPPHKGHEDAMAPAAERLAWVRLAVADHPCFEVADLEIRREGPSYSAETLRLLREELGEVPVFVVGHDAFVEMGSWHRPGEIFRQAHVAVTTRPPVSGGRLESWLPDAVADAFEVDADGAGARHREAGTRIHRVAITALDISASDLRERLRAGRSTRYLLPEAVRKAVADSGCFAPPPDAPPGASPSGPSGASTGASSGTSMASSAGSSSRRAALESQENR